MTAKPLRIVFAGTPDFAAAHLSSLITERFDLVGAYSQPDRPTGRGKKILPTPVKAVAEAAGLPVYQPESFDPTAIATLASFQPDVMVVVAYGLLLPPPVLALPTYGCINVHASLLPRWRGAAPIERAILSGDKESGVCIMQMDAGLDTGPVLSRAVTPILADDNSATLTARLMELGCRELSSVLAQIATGTAKAIPQDESLALYARKLKKEEAAILWSDTAAYIHNQVRAFFPRSPAFCLHSGQRLRIIAARVASIASHAHVPGTIVELGQDLMHVACGEGILAVSEIQLEGKTPMRLAALFNGHPDFFRKGDLLQSARAHVQAQ